MTIKQDIINKTNGKFFSVIYQNKQGEISKYIVRTGVWKHLKGGTNHCPKGAVTLYAVSKDGDREKAGYRSMFLDSILRITTKNDTLYCGV